MKWDIQVDDRPNTQSPRIRFSRNFSDRYLKRANKILDIGCGIGSYTSIIDRKDCYAIDVDLTALKTAKKHCPNSQFILASVLNLPFRAHVFDTVFVWEVFEYIENEIEINTVQEIYRIMEDGANLLVSAPNHHFIYNIVDPDHFLLHRQRHFEIRNLIRLFTENGFSIKEQTIRGGWKTILAMNVFYLNKHLLHKKGGKIQRFLDKKSEEELNSKLNGIANIFIAAEKNTH